MPPRVPEPFPPDAAAGTGCARPGTATTRVRPAVASEGVVRPGTAATDARPDTAFRRPSDVAAEPAARCAAHAIDPK